MEDEYSKLLEKAMETLDSDVFDDLVIECKLSEATGINNAGIDIQLEYIEESLGKDEALKALREALKICPSS